VASISQGSEELGLYNLVYKLTILNPGLKAVSSNVSLGLTVRLFIYFFFLWMMIGVF
jgi:hypothetical protein